MKADVACIESKRNYDESRKIDLENARRLDDINNETNIITERE